MRSLQRRVTHAVVASATFCAVLVSASTTASAAPVVRNVPGDYPSIQAGIDAAVNGDSVLVAQGTYVENIDFKGKAIKVKSTRGAAATTIDAGGRGPVVTFASGEGRASLLRGFTLQHGRAETAANVSTGGGVRVDGASPEVRDNVVRANAAAFGAGVGIRAGSPLIVHNVIVDNTGLESGGIGGGVFISGYPNYRAEIRRNTIARNANDYGGGIGTISAGLAVVRDNAIADNVGGLQGGGMWLSTFSRVIEFFFSHTTALCDKTPSDDG